MATNAVKSTGHASYQRHSNIPFGQRNKPKRVATDCEVGQLNKAIVSLSQAKTATTEAAMVAAVTEAFKLTRQITRSRIL